MKYEDEYSQLRETQAGDPQGSIRGSLLYVLYISDIPKVAGTTMATFADDTAIFSVVRTENEAKHKLQNALTSALECSRKWCIKLNSSKSTIPGNCRADELTRAGALLSKSSSITWKCYLPYLNWKSHGNFPDMLTYPRSMRSLAPPHDSGLQ